MSLGNWSFAFEDFDREDLLHQLDNPEWQALQKIIDPFNYRLKLENTPKYSITCSGDPFFLERLFLHVDNSDFVTNIYVRNILYICGQLYILHICGQLAYENEPMTG